MRSLLALTALAFGNVAHASTDCEALAKLTLQGVAINLAFPELRRGARSVIEKQVDVRRTFYERNHVPIFHGQARFVDEHTIDVVDEEETRHRLSADFFVLAVGARPYRPPNVDFAHPRIIVRKRTESK